MQEKEITINNASLWFLCLTRFLARAFCRVLFGAFPFLAWAALDFGSLVFGQAPSALTLPATNVIGSTTTLQGRVSNGGIGTTAWFEWDVAGIAIPRGLSWPVALEANADSAMLAFGLTNLTPGMPYQYRVVASNAQAVARGRAIRFGSLDIALQGGSPFTNALNTPWIEPGVNLSSLPWALAAGSGFNLGLKADGSITGWGRNDLGQLGIPVLTNAAAVSAGSVHSLAVRTDGSVIAWGRNFSGALNVPPSLANAVAVAAGNDHSLALRADGTVLTWGDNSYGQCNPQPNLSNVVAIAAGGWHNLALQSDGTVVAWGAGTLNTGVNRQDGQCIVPPSATNIVSIAANAWTSLALRADGQIIAWGRDCCGLIDVPPNATNVVAISSAPCSGYSFALRADGTVVCWGDGCCSHGSIPSAATNVVAIAGGCNHSLALRADGAIIGWGDDSFGQLTAPADLNNLNLSPTIVGVVDPSTPGSYRITYSAAGPTGGIGLNERMVVVPPPSFPPLLIRNVSVESGFLDFDFTNAAGGVFAILKSGNIAVPASQWTEVGHAEEVAPGQFHFRDGLSLQNEAYYRVVEVP